MVMSNNTTQIQIQQALDHYKSQGRLYLLFENYYDGNHRLNFAASKMKNAFGHLFQAFADNLCSAVVDAEVDRLHITGFQGDASDEAWKLWKKDRLDDVANAVHEETLKLGDGFLLIWPTLNPNRPTITGQPADTMYVHYDDEAFPDYATKCWRTDNNQWRLNLFLENRLEKYVTTSASPTLPSKASAFRRFAVAGEIWPLAYPPGFDGMLPVFHLTNRAGLKLYGRSELINAIPIQDALNKTIADMLIAMEFVAMPQRWATGLEFDTDPETGKPIQPFKSGVDRIWASGDPDTKFGQFEQADITKFTQVSNDFRAAMARDTNTPPHYLALSGSGAQNPFVASPPTGESQKTAEAPFIAKTKKAQTRFGDKWEDIFKLRLRLDGRQPEALETVWSPAESRSKPDEVEMAVKKVEKLGVPKRVVWKDELAYTDQQIEEMEALIKAEQEANPAPAQPNLRVLPGQSTETDIQANGPRSGGR